MPAVYDNDGTTHAIRWEDRPGSALCGFPPMRANGDRWLPSDPAPRDLRPQEIPVTCVYCLRFMSGDTV